jgi:Flp pilus assembly protein TadB
VLAGRAAAATSADNTRSKRARTSGASAAAAAAAATGDSGGRAERSAGKNESVVEKRLKQNREAARRSRERKRLLKEELQRRLPVLQKQHEDMVVEVDELMRSMWVRTFLHLLLFKHLCNLSFKQLCMHLVFSIYRQLRLVAACLNPVHLQLL